MTRRVTDLQQLYLAGVTGNATIDVPAGYAIRDVFVRNRTANAVTGGVRVGTTDGGADVVVALALGASAFVVTLPLVRLFSAVAAQTLYVQAVVAWNSATVDVVITLDRAIA